MNHEFTLRTPDEVPEKILQRMERLSKAWEPTNIDGTKTYQITVTLVELGQGTGQAQLPSTAQTALSAERLSDGFPESFEQS